MPTGFAKAPALRLDTVWRLSIKEAALPLSG
jgi:hypothetical protein